MENVQERLQELSLDNLKEVIIALSVLRDEKAETAFELAFNELGERLHRGEIEDTEYLEFSKSIK